MHQDFQNRNISAQDKQDIDDFVEFQLYPEGKTFCPYHGLQNTVGNHDECEQCLLDYKEKQLNSPEYLAWLAAGQPPQDE